MKTSVATLALAALTMACAAHPVAAETVEQFYKGKTVEMIVGAAWWDIVDTIAGHGVGTLLRNDPKPMKREMSSRS